eukprot:842671_1
MDDNKDLKTKPHYRCHKVLMHYQPTFSLSECAMKCKNDEKCNFVAYEAGESRQKLTACQKCAEGGPKVHVPMEGWIVVHAPNTNLDPAHLYDNTDDLKEDEKPEKTSIVFGGNMKEHINRHVAVMTDPFNHTDELRNLFDVVLIAIVLYAIFSVYSKRKNRMIKEKASPRLPTTESNLSKQQFEPIGRMYPAASDMPAGSTFERMVVSSPNHMQMQPGPAASWPGSMQSAAFQQNVPSFMYARTQPSPRSSVTQAYRRQMHASQMLHNPMQSYQMQPAHMQPGSMQSGAMQPGHMHPGAMQPGHMQPGTMQPGHMQPGTMQMMNMQPVNQNQLNFMQSNQMRPMQPIQNSPTGQMVQSDLKSNVNYPTWEASQLQNPQPQAEMQSAAMQLGPMQPAPMKMQSAPMQMQAAPMQMQSYPTQMQSTVQMQLQQQMPPTSPVQACARVPTSYNDAQPPRGPPMGLPSESGPVIDLTGAAGYRG